MTKEMQDADRVILEKLCHTPQLPHEVVELYWKARIGWERIQGGPMPSDALLMLVVECDAVYTPEVVPNRYQETEPGTTVYWSNGSTNYHGTFSHCCVEPFTDQVVVLCYGDRELARQVRAADVETEAELQARLEQDAIDEPQAAETNTVPDGPVVEGDHETEEPKSEDPVEPPVESALRQEWEDTEAGTKLHLAVPGEAAAEAEFLKLNTDDTLEVSVGGNIRNVSAIDVMRA